MTTQDVVGVGVNRISMISTKALYVICGTVAALFVNGQFGIHFAEHSSSGGPGTLIMWLVGLILSALDAAIFFETSYTSYHETSGMSLTSVDVAGIVVVGLVQTAVISSGIYLPVFVK